MYREDRLLFTHAKALDLINKGISQFLFVYSSLVKSSFGVLYKPSVHVANRRPEAGQLQRLTFEPWPFSLPLSATWRFFETRQMQR
jgi:hypothetical protein